MVRTKMVLDLSYLGTRYVGWQPQPRSQQLEAAGVDELPLPGHAEDRQPAAGADLPLLPGPCRLYNRGRCTKGGGCRAAHICSRCYRDGARRPHPACHEICDTFRMAAEGELSLQEVIDSGVRKAFGNSPLLQRLLKSPPSGIVGSGRTDRGVHARQMLGYCNLQVAAAMDEASIRQVVATFPQLLNCHLPADVRCRGTYWTADALFWTRGSTRKTYVYYLADGAASAEALGSVAEGVWQLDGPPLDLAAMSEAAAAIVGRHDFAAFTSVTGRDTVREVSAVLVEPVVHESFDALGCCFFRGRGRETTACEQCGGGVAPGDDDPDPAAAAPPRVRLVAVRVTGYGFLKHMVRRIVGQLVAIGQGGAAPGSCAELLLTPGVESAARSKKAPKAPACGLWLHSVEPLGDEHAAAVAEDRESPS